MWTEQGSILYLRTNNHSPNQYFFMKKLVLSSLMVVLATLFSFAQDHIVTLSGFVFTPSNLTITQGESVLFDNVSGLHNVNGSLATYPNNPEGFSSGAVASAPWQFTHTFNTPGVYDFRCDQHIGVNMVGTITVEPAGGLPMYDIATVTTVDAQGVLDSLDVECQLQGIVHGVDLRTGPGVQFTMIDATGGIGVFSGGLDTYTVQEGDEIIVEGTMNQFNGLAQITPTSITLVSAGNPTENPTVVTTLSEATESELIRLNGLTLVDPLEWLGNGNSYNVNVTDGSNTFVMRLDNEVDLAAMPAPIGSFDLIGIGGQFDQDAPFDDGYQILPRYADDLILNITDVIANDDLVETNQNTTVTFNVLDNDLLPPGNIIEVVVISDPGSGMLMGDMEGGFTFSPALDFCGDVTFVYEACVEGTMNCAQGTVTISVICAPTYPAYDIATVTTVDIAGQPDSLGVTCQVQGIVHGIDLQGNDDVQFFLIDATGGISVFGSGNFGYTVQEGDEIIIQGTITEFNCLSQIAPDNIELLSSGNPTVTPAVVTSLSEAQESELIQINNLTIVDPSDWTGMGAGFNVEVTDGSNTYQMRIDNEVDLYGMAAPTGTFNAIGLGGQFDNAAPCDQGYQFLPRYMEDIIPVLNTEQVDLSGVIQFFPNPAGVELYIRSTVEVEQILVRDLLGGLRAQYGNVQRLDLSGLSAGYYLISFVTEQGIWTDRFSKL